MLTAVESLLTRIHPSLQVYLSEKNNHHLHRIYEMSDLPTATTPFTIQGLREVCEVTFDASKAHNNGPNTSLKTTHPGPIPQDVADPLYLSLIHETQNDDELLHWSLYIAHENQTGDSYQVTGDAELMTYIPSIDVIDATKSESFLILYQLPALTEQQALVVKQVAEK
ncbi:hypothetical protein ZTR_06785 [Talaromyces verruculosus]|nr:hypothetical protein ZTR_06785 [Talaromyces verruculosus]